MRINPIQTLGFDNRNKKIRQNNIPETISYPNTVLSNNDSYGRALLTFKSGLSSDIVKQVRQTKLEDKLAFGNAMLDYGEMLIASKNIETAKAAIQRYTEVCAHPIKRLLILTEQKLGEDLLFLKVAEGLAYRNVNEWPTRVNGFELILPGKGAILQNDDHIRVTNGWVRIKEEPETEVDLEKYSSLFLKDLNYAEETRELIKNHNKKVVQAIAEKDEKKNKPFLTDPFDAVGGQDENIDALKKNILFPIKYPEAFEGLMLSRGTILYGPPGTGKTLLAETLCKAANVSIFQQCATDFAAKYVGESEANCRELFQKAVDGQPSIIFLDEIDALGKSRGDDVHGDKLLNQFLSLMSNLEKNQDQVFIIGATNKKEDLDKALTRSGRFDLMLECKLPDLKGTKQILDKKVKNKKLDKSVDLDELAKAMFQKNMSGADITSAVKNAHINALERTGIYRNMETGNFCAAEMDYFSLTKEDFDKALESFNNGNKKIAPVGYKPWN